MMWKEFEKIAGYEVSYETYSKIIEPMYMALPEEIDKYKFVKMLDKKAFALPTPQEILKEVKKEAKNLYAICGHYSDYESREKMKKAAIAYAKRKFDLDWEKDSEVYIFFENGYEYPALQRGCTYPRELVIGRAGNEYERIQLNP